MASLRVGSASPACSTARTARASVPCKHAVVAQMHCMPHMHCTSVPATSSHIRTWGRRADSLVVRSNVDDSTRSLKETAALDELIDKLLAAKSEQELARLVAENIFNIDPKFWLRVATRNDTASGKDDKERLQVMAEKVMVLVGTVMKRTEQQLADSSKVLQEILASAADERGEWYLPLTADQVTKLRAALDKHADKLDEALLSNAFAWIRKCSEDRFDSMVQLIQKVLQLYAAKQLKGDDTTGVEGLVNKVIYAEESEWGPLIRVSVGEGSISEPQFMEALQRRMEATVLGLQSGSYAQRVQAEYLKEIEARARSVFKELAESKA